MQNVIEYTPKFLTKEHILLIDQIIIENRSEYLRAVWKQSIFSAIKINFIQRLNTLLKKYFPEESSNQQLINRSRISLSKNNIFSILGLTRSPEQFWLFKQTHRIREEIDMMMPSLVSNENLSNEKLIENINKTISNFSIVKIDKHSPISIFTNKVKIHFLNKLKTESTISLNVGRKKKTNDKLKDGTTSQKNAVFYYLFENGQLNNPHIDNTKFADLICFATGRNRDNIRKNWANIFKENPKSMAKDLMAIRPLFEGIGAQGIVEMIDRDLRG